MHLKSYKFTFLACYIGYIVQALVNNLTPLLYARFNTEFGITNVQLSIIPLVNFSLQLIMDWFAPFFVLKFGVRKCTVTAHTLCTIGMVLLCILPYVMLPFAGILIATFFLAIGGGFIEVIVSPLVDSLPVKNKSGAMNILHSFYCFGHIITVLIATLYFKTAGINLWRWLPLIVGIIPLANLILFCLCPLVSVKGDESKEISYRSIITMRGFMCLFLGIVCAGAAEISIAQWASYFGEVALNIEDKAISDLLGVCMFATAMAFTRLIFGFFGDRIQTDKAIIFSFLFLLASYAIVGFARSNFATFVGFFLCGIFVAILWPSIYSLSAKKFANKGTRMFGLLALGGDAGCTLGPTLVGLVSSDIKIGLAVAMIFPAIGLISMLVFVLLNKKKKQL